MTVSSEILVVDDTPASLKLLVDLLKAEGYKVRATQDPKLAIESALANPPDLILLDVKMPAMDGFEVCQRLKQEDSTKGVPVIFVSALQETSDRVRGFDVGGVDFITKPIQREEVMARVSTQLELSLMRHKLEELVDERTQQWQQSDEKYRRLVEGLKDEYFFYIRDADGTFSYLSPSVEGVLGFSPEELHTQYSQNVQNNLFQQMEQKHAQLSHVAAQQSPYVLEVRDKDDSSHWLEIKDTPLFDEQGQMISVEGIAHDITSRKKIEESLHQAQKMDALGTLTSGIAHDFNNMLGVILGNLSLIERQIPADEKTLKHMKAMKKAGNRAATLTKQLLTFSRGHSDKVEASDINQVIKGMENLIVRSVTPEVEVELMLADSLWLSAIDSGEFEDVLLNLSINARDAMKGHGHINIETFNVSLDATYCTHNPEAKPGQYVQLAVSDCGEGITPEQLEHIFEPFYTTKDEGKGTGLGLAMVYGFVKRSKGHIKVHSDPGIGTTFLIYLPRAEKEENSVDDSDESIEPAPHGAETILAVDDETDLLELAKEYLETLDYRVITATDGWQALDLLAENPAIDLLFSDVVMPGGINGYQLAEQALTKRPNLKVLLTSGYPDDAAIHHSYTHFNANLLGKPYTQNELATQIRTLLDDK